MNEENQNIIGESHEAVAFALMTVIAKHEIRFMKEKGENPRKYYLDLYAECLRATDRAERPADPKAVSVFLPKPGEPGK